MKYSTGNLYLVDFHGKSTLKKEGRKENSKQKVRIYISPWKLTKVAFVAGRKPTRKRETS